MRFETPSEQPEGEDKEIARIEKETEINIWMQAQAAKNVERHLDFSAEEREELEGLFVGVKGRDGRDLKDVVPYFLEQQGKTLRMETLRMLAREGGIFITPLQEDREAHISDLEFRLDTFKRAGGLILSFLSSRKPELQPSLRARSYLRENVVKLSHRSSSSDRDFESHDYDFDYILNEPRSASVAALGIELFKNDLLRELLYLTLDPETYKDKILGWISGDFSRCGNEKSLLKLLAKAKTPPI